MDRAAALAAAPPAPSAKQRLYRRRDIDIILLVKKLLYEQRFTIAGARKKLHRKPRGHEKAHQLSAPVRCDVDAEYLPRGIYGRAAAHARIDRTGEMDALVVELFRPAIVDALDDRQSLTQGVAQGEAVITLRQRPGAKP